MSRVFPGCPVRIASAAAVLALVAGPALAAADPLGDWITEDKRGVITVAPCGDAVCGAITGVSTFPPGGLRDVTGAPECQLRIIKDMKPGDDGKLHGTVTDPTDGKVYHAQLWVDESDALRLRGYVGVPWLGSTRVWTRFSGTKAADCHFTPG